MFLSALQPYIVAIIIAVIIAQYAFALFCLLKLAYLDIDKKHYVMWNLFILIVFFIGGGVFLVYYYKHPELKISTPPKDGKTEQDFSEQAEQNDIDPSESTDNRQAESDIADVGDGSAPVCGESKQQDGDRSD